MFDDGRGVMAQGTVLFLLLPERAGRHGQDKSRGCGQRLDDREAGFHRHAPQ
jgi:hypothetical protein